MAFDWIKGYIAKRRYMGELEDKYRRFGKAEMSAIYQELLKYQESTRRAEEGKKKLPYIRDPDEKISILAQGVVADQIEEKIKKNYRISINKAYLQYDIEYVKGKL